MNIFWNWFCVFIIFWCAMTVSNLELLRSFIYALAGC